jgi:V8-like Glu-specific endopeptidase
MLKSCFVATAVQSSTEPVVRHCSSNVGSTQWRTTGRVLNALPTTSFNAPLTFILEASVCGGMSGSPIWLQHNGAFLLIGLWCGFSTRTSIAFGTRIHGPMLQEIRRWMREDGVAPAF